jgi:hypothetical protein
MQGLDLSGALFDWMYLALVLLAVLGAGVFGAFREARLFVLVFLDVHVDAFVHVQISQDLVLLPQFFEDVVAGEGVLGAVVPDHCNFAEFGPVADVFGGVVGDFALALFVALLAVIFPVLFEDVGGVGSLVVVEVGEFFAVDVPDRFLHFYLGSGQHVS